MKNGNAIVFTGGLGPDRNRIDDTVRNADIIIAADSGWDLARGLGVVPDYYIGDMDSVEDHEGLELLDRQRVLIYPEDKDYTDTELALKFLEERNYRDIVLIGGGGGRIDHLIAIIYLFRCTCRPSEWFTASEHIIYSADDLELECSMGKTISIFAGPGDDAVISTRGLKWELERCKINTEKFSVSNRAIGTSVDIKVHKGAVLVMLNY